MTDFLKQKYSNLIKAEAQRLGFLSCGISKATFLEEEAPRLEKWLSEGRNGEMSYMENYFDMRLDPRLIVDQAKSVISLLLNYYPSEMQNPESYKISKYAYGRDYHLVIKDKLKILLQTLNDQIGEINGRAFVDSAPILDKAWAQRSGLGWVGKNNNLIAKKTGSFFFVCELVVDIDLAFDIPTTDHCGNCTACIDACPTQAIVEPYLVDGSKCISYFTIELKNAIPIEMKDKFDDWMFGCDVCQDVCPWNKFAKPHSEPLFQPHTNLIKFNKSDWEEITLDVFNEIFKKSSVKRAKLPGLHRNIAFLK